MLVTSAIPHRGHFPGPWARMSLSIGHMNTVLVDGLSAAASNAAGGAACVPLEAGAGPAPVVELP